MTYRGRVRNGALVLDEPLDLPEGAIVTIAVFGDFRSDSAGKDIPSLYEQFEPIIGKARGLPADLAENHDHYLHGLARK